MYLQNLKHTYVAPLPGRHWTNLNDSAEPAGVADVLQTDRVVSESPPLVRIERIHRDAGERESDLLESSLSLCQTGLQCPGEGEREGERERKEKEREGEGEYRGEGNEKVTE